MDIAEKPAQNVVLSSAEQTGQISLISLAQRLDEHSQELGQNIYTSYQEQIQNHLTVTGAKEYGESQIRIQSSAIERDLVTVSFPLGKVESGKNWAMTLPRAIFNFRGTSVPNQVEYSGCQIGLGGSIVGVGHIIETIIGTKKPLGAKPSLPGFLSSTFVEVNDLNILMLFMDNSKHQNPSLSQLPSQT